MSKNRTLKVGVIGAGGIAHGVHLPSLSEIEGVDIVAICDLVESRAQEQAERFSIPRTYTLVREMLGTEELDAVFALVEPGSLFHVVMICLEHGLPTFMEKPPGVTSFQAKALCRAADKAGVILQVGFNRRHVPVVQQAVKLMREATTISQVEGRFMKCGTAAFDKGGMSAYSSDTIHAVDMVRWIAGGRAESAATVQGQAQDVVPNSWNSVIRFDNGVTGIVKANYQTGGRSHTFEVHGPGASAFINLGFAGGQDCEARIVLSKGKAGYSLAATGASDNGVQVIDGMELAGSREFYKYYGFYQEDVHFVECVRTGAEPLTSIEEAVKTFELVDMLLANLI